MKFQKTICIIVLLSIFFNMALNFCLIDFNFAQAVDIEKLDYNSDQIQDLVNMKKAIQEDDATVEPQKNGYDLIIFMGQSNMVGYGNSAYAEDAEAFKYTPVKPIDGAGYEIVFDDNNIAEGMKPTSQIFGEGNGLNVSADKKAETTGNLVTAFMNAYYKNTGTPVIGIPAAYGGTSVFDDWQEGDQGEEALDCIEKAKMRLESAITYLNNNNVKIKHKYMVWYQGEADVEDFLTYEKYLRNTVESIQDSGIERSFLIRIGYPWVNDVNDEEEIERYSNYTNMINKQTDMCWNKNSMLNIEEPDEYEDRWITLVSTSASTLTKCSKMLVNYKIAAEEKKYTVDQVHLNQEALDIVGSEAGKNVAYYADQSREGTLTQSQKDSLINYTNNFAYWGTKNEAILYGTLAKSVVYNLQGFAYKSVGLEEPSANYRREIYYDSGTGDLVWKNLNAGTQSNVGEYGFNGEKEFKQGNYLGLDCSGFISFLYHQVFGLPFNYYYNGSEYTPWTALQYIENRKFLHYDGDRDINAFKIIYQKVYKKDENINNGKVSFKDVLNEANNLQVGDILVGLSGKVTNHVVMYAGDGKIIHSTSNPVGYKMKIESLNKYCHIGMSEPSDFKYQQVYVLRLNSEALPKNYVTKDIYRTESNTSYIDWDIIKEETRKIDNVNPALNGDVHYTYDQAGHVTVTINTTEAVMPVRGWKLSDNKKMLSKDFTSEAVETIVLEDFSANKSEPIVVTVTLENEITEIFISNNPNKTKYFVGEELDFTGGTITVKYKDNTTENVEMNNENISIIDYDKNRVGEQIVTVAYKNKTTTFKVTVEEKSVTGIKINSEPDKTTYIIGEELDITGGTITVIYNDNSTEILELENGDIQITGYDKNRPAEQTITVAYKNKTTTFKVTVEEKTVIVVKEEYSGLRINLLRLK